MSFRIRLKAGAFALPLLFSSSVAMAQSVEMLFVIDETGSMEEEQQFIRDNFIPAFESSLQSRGYTDRQYGLWGFGNNEPGDSANSVPLQKLFDLDPTSPSFFGDAAAAQAGISGLKAFGGSEDPYRSIEEAEQFFFPDTRSSSDPVRVIVLVTDEDRDAFVVVDPRLPPELSDIQAIWSSKDIVPVHIVNHGLTDGNGQAVLAANSTTLFLEDGGVATSISGTVVPDISTRPTEESNSANSSVVADYITPALGTPNGCVADLGSVNPTGPNVSVGILADAVVQCSLAAITNVAPISLTTPGPVTVPPGSLRTRSFIIYGSRDQIRLFVKRSHDLLRGHRTVVSAFAPDPETLSVSTANVSGELASPSHNSPIQFSFSADTGSAENIAESGIQAIFAALQEGANDEPLRVEIGSISAFALFEASDATYDLDQRFDSYDSTGGIALMGMDYEVQPGVTVGAAAAYQVFELEAHERRDEVDVDGYSLSLFGDTMIAPNTVLDGTLSYTTSQFDTTRETDNDGLAFSNTKGYAVSASASLSHEVSQGQYLITPSLSLAAIHTSFDNFNEYGDDPNIYYGDDETIFSIEPKIQVGRNIVEDEWVITPTAGLGAVIVQDGDEGTVRSISRNGFIANPELAPTENLSGLISLNLVGSRMDYGASFNIGYSGEFGRDITRHSIIAGAKLRF